MLAREDARFDAICAGLPHMRGKIAAVTGCTSGLGLFCARVFARLGAHVVMLNRPSERAITALSTVRAEVTEGMAELVHCDLLDFSSVRLAAEMLRHKFGTEGIDVLCNNAGIVGERDLATADGCDPQMQTNHLSHFLLTLECLPLLELAAGKRGEARVVHHSSILRYRPNKSMDEDYLSRNGGKLGGHWIWPSLKRYQQSKLANVVFTYALCDRLRGRGSKVKALVAHPGATRTSLLDNGFQKSGVVGFLLTFVMLSYLKFSGYYNSIERGAEGILWCCCAEDVASGAFYGPGGLSTLCGPAVLLPCEPLADQHAKDMLWRRSVETTGCGAPSVSLCRTTSAENS